MKQKSIYKYAAEAGVPVGVYLTLMAACFFFSMELPILSLLIFPLALGFPFYLGYFVRKIGKLQPSYMKFSSLWLGGIYTVIFGTLICMFFSSIYVVFFNQGFVNSYCVNIIETLESSPVASEYEASVEMLKRMIDLRLLPSAMDFVISLGWFTCFSGSILSLIIAAIISRNSNNVRKVLG